MDTLKTTYVDAAFTGSRKYTEVDNGDGTKSFTDSTSYTTAGDKFGAKDINDTNKVVNAVMGVKTAVFSASGWSTSAPYSQTVSVSGILASDAPIIGLQIASDASASTAKTQNTMFSRVDRVITSDGSITAYCYNKLPTADFTVMIKGV